MLRTIGEPARRLHQRAVLKLMGLKGRLGMNRQVFTDIYRFNLWGSAESRSGPGSSLASTEWLRKKLPPLLEQFGIRTMLDAGCGDCNWISRTALDLDLYIGAEIVPALVATNRQRYGDLAEHRRQFIRLDISRDKIPTVDLIFCRHCLIHLPIDEVIQCFENIRKSGSKYVMATTIPDCSENCDVFAGGFRPLNLEIEPFLFPEPVARLNDPVVIGGQYRKEGWLYLWPVSDLPSPNKTGRQ